MQNRGIDCDAQPLEDGTYQVWIEDEDHLTEAKELLILFHSDPTNDKFKVTKQKKAPQSSDRSKYVNVRRDVFSAGNNNYGTVTICLILTSIFATFVLDLPTYKWLQYKLYYSEFMGRGFPEIRNGQVWRIITPIFMHGGLLHIVFNMLWLHQLATQVEKVEGPRYILLMVLSLAAIANTGQYLVSGPLFVGMSGVVYGLLGYIWMMTRYKYNSPYTLSQGTVTFMVIWMLICLVGIIPHVANTEHVLGFCTGTFWGLLKSGGIKAEWRRYNYKKSRK